MLDDPALRLKVEPVLITPVEPARFRFRPSSTFARDFGLPRGAEGWITSRYQRDGCDVLNVTVDDVGCCTGVPLAEIIEHGDDAHPG